MNTALDIMFFLLLILFGVVMLMIYSPVATWQMWREFRRMQEQDREIRESFKA